jgi:ribosomal protein L40E
MSDDVQQEPTPKDGHMPFDVIDADAVCSECGEVNPQGTVLCKQCGNNLREQRLRRIETGPLLDVEGGHSSPLRLLTGLIALLGVLLVLWTAFNVETIVDWMAHGMTRADVEREFRPRDLWRGEDGRVFTDLGNDLGEPGRMLFGMSATAPAGDDLTGRYQLRPMQAIGMLNQPVGEAVVARDEGTFYVLARLANGTEIRAKAEQVGRDLVTRRAGIFVQGQHIPAMGYTSRAADGSLAVYAQSTLAEGVYTVLAYRLAEHAPASADAPTFAP